MARKRTSLATLLADDDTDDRQDESPRRTRRDTSNPAPATNRARETARSPQPAPPESAAGRRAHVKQQTVYLPLPVYEQLRRLAFEERSKMHGLLMEGLDRVFKDRGLSSIADLQRQKDG